MIENKYKITAEYFNHNGLKCVGTRNYGSVMSALKKYGMEIINTGNPEEINFVWACNVSQCYDSIAFSYTNLYAFIFNLLASPKLQKSDPGSIDKDKFIHDINSDNGFTMLYDDSNGERFTIKIEKDIIKEPYSLCVEYLNNCNLSVFDEFKNTLYNRAQDAFKSFGFVYMDGPTANIKLERNNLRYTEALSLAKEIYNNLNIYSFTPSSWIAPSVFNNVIKEYGSVFISVSGEVLKFSIKKEEKNND